MLNYGQLYFNEVASLQMEGILYLHEHIFGLISGILVTVLIMYRRILLRGLGVKSSIKDEQKKIKTEGLFFYEIEQKNE